MQFTVLEWCTQKFKASNKTKAKLVVLDIKIALLGTYRHQPICVFINGYYLDYNALSNPPFLFFYYDIDCNKGADSLVASDYHGAVQ